MYVDSDEYRKLLNIETKSPVALMMERNAAAAARVAQAKAQLIPLRDIAGVQRAKEHRTPFLATYMQSIPASEVFVRGRTYAFAVGEGEVNMLTFVKEEVIAHLGESCLFFALFPRFEDLPLFVCRRRSFETELFRWMFRFNREQAVHELDLGGVSRARSRTHQKRPRRWICRSITSIRSRRKASCAKARRKASGRRK